MDFYISFETPKGADEEYVTFKRRKAAEALLRSLEEKFETREIGERVLHEMRIQVCEYRTTTPDE